MAEPLAIIRTGTANLASILAGFRRAGAEPVLTTDPEVVRRAERVVLPGVGAFGAAMEALRDHALVDALVERADADRPLFAVCLGLQLLAESSEETPGVAGLGIVAGTVTRFSGDLVVPQLGWNKVEPEAESRFITPGYAYYANSYKLDALPAGWSGATTDHGGRFVAALERGALLACQFHPELSGPWGAAVIERWLT